MSAVIRGDFIIRAQHGRRSVLEGAPYAEAWAQRHPFGQSLIERDRLLKGKARHRAHRNPLPLRDKGPKP